MTPGSFTGSCLCGAIRFEVDHVFDVFYCHCESCRRSSGAPVLLTAHVAGDAFRLKAGSPSCYRTSESGRSYFCGTCGSGLYGEYEAPSHLLARGGRYFSVRAGTFDDPERLRPMIHQFVEKRLSWFEIADDLLRIEGNRLPHPDKRAMLRNEIVSHAPSGYDCPLCRMVRGEFEAKGMLITADDVVAKTGAAVAFVSPHWFSASPGHCVVAPTAHFENIYSLPRVLAAEVHQLAGRVALAMKRATNHSGISTLQNNEPPAGQSVWHYHLHVIPRYSGDRFSLGAEGMRLTTPVERKPLGESLRAALNESPLS